MSGWLAPAMISILSGSILLAVVFTYLAISEHEVGMGLWSAAWTLYSLRFVVDLAQASLAPNSVVLTALSQLLVLATALLLLEGTGQMADSRVPRWPLYVGGAVVLWVLGASWAHAPVVYLTGPVFTLRGIASVMAGIMWWRTSAKTGQWGKVTGAAFIGWGIHNLDFPFLVTVTWFAPVGFLIGAVFEYTIAIGALIAYFERTRRLLAASEASYRALADNARDVIVRYRHAPEQGLDFVSAGVSGLLGYDAAEVLERPELLLGELNAEDSLGTALSGGYDFAQPAVFAMLHRDGSSRYAEVHGSLVADQGGGRSATEVVIRDVTDRVRADQAVQESSERYTALFQKSASTMLLVDPATATIVDANDAAERFYGWSRAELCGMPLAQINGMEADELLASTAHAGQDGTNHFLLTHAHADGSETPVEVYTGRMRISGKDVLYSIVHDITDRVNAERALAENRANLEELVAERTEDLVRANAQLEAATHAKDDFLTGMSHELRTPLNSVIGFSSILLQELPGPLNVEQRHQIQMIEHSGRHLLSIVNQILDLSSVEAGGEAPRPVDVDVSVLVAQIIDALQPLAAERAIALRVNVEPGLRLRTDERFLEQILWNLLGNAIKYTDHGHARLDVRAEGEEMVFEVDDTGCGMDEEQLAHAFDRFTRFQVPSPVWSGTGLGLTISRRLAEQLSGTLTAKSVPGEGSRFVLRLPR